MQCFNQTRTSISNKNQCPNHGMTVSQSASYPARLRITLALCLLLVQWMAGFASAATVQESAGELDLRGANWGQGKVHRLDGDWLLFPGRFMAPEDMAALLTSARPEWDVSWVAAPVPGFWNETLPDFERFGVGTLALTVKVPAGVPLYLQLSDLPSAYRLFVNGRQMAQVGSPALMADAEVPMFRPRLIELGASDGQLVIVVQVSNFHYKQIGVRRSIQLTDASGYAHLREAPLLFDIFFCGVLVTIGVILLSRFSRWRNDRASLYLGLFSLMVGSRALLVGERILYQLDWFSWSGLQKAEHILLYGGLAAFGAYLYELLDGGMSRRFLQVLGVISLSLIAFTAFLPVYQGTLTVIPFKLLVAGVALYVLFSYWPLLKSRGAGVFWFVASFIVLLLALATDLISQNTQFQSRPVVHWGMVLFVVCQTLFLNHVRHWRRRRLRENGSGNNAPLPDPAGDTGPLQGETDATVKTLFEELGASRRKIEDLEGRLLQLHENLVPSGAVPVNTFPAPAVPVIAVQLPASLESLQGEDSARLALVALLRSALSLWERYGGKSKVQLAEESRCWRVYVDGSTVKTRTFDKYLTLKSLPGKPRWRLVTRTAWFVAENVALPEADRAQLEVMIKTVEGYYA
jgi:hypothetical protein